MADYRLSAQIIGRSSGRSSVAAAAYRAGEELYDARTGEVHDFTRKEGVLHSEIMAPANAPEWMADRAQLWNAVEAVETRRNSQMAREVQLSLPHQLSFDANRQLVREFVLEQFVAKGMIADIAVHAPNREGDERNFHAHVMLTTRTLTDDGFGKKNRDWNDRAQLEAWREQWAAHQNRALSRAGDSERVDHRSFKRQGIDQEPTVHMGPHATEMQRMGLQTELGAQNEAIRARNAQRAQVRVQVRAQDGVLDAKPVFEQRKFESWADRKRDQVAAEQADQRVEQGRQAEARKTALTDRLEKTHGAEKAQLAQDQGRVENRLDARGLRKIVRDVLGRTRRDRAELDALKARQDGIARIELKNQEQLKAAIQAERARLKAQQAQETHKLETGINRARERREADGWQSQKDRFGSGPLPRPQENSQDLSQDKPNERARTKRGPLIDASAKRAYQARQDRSAKLQDFYQKIEASRGIGRPSPEKPGPAQDFSKARKNEKRGPDRDRDQ
ncbi:MAG: MobQ family relaxase [Pseudomonadota bacterium]